MAPYSVYVDGPWDVDFMRFVRLPELEGQGGASRRLARNFRIAPGLVSGCFAISSPR